MSNLTRSLMLGGGGSSSGSTYLGPMTWAELQASAYANGSVGLAALDADDSVVITDWRVEMTPNSDKTFWTSSSPIIIAAFGSPALGNDVVYTANGTTCTAVASASAGAATRLTITGHGLTSANNGVSVYIASGTNWTAGLYAMTYVDANTIDVAAPWNASYGNPVVRSVTGSGLQTTLRTVDIPAGLMQAHSSIELSSTWEMTSSANNRYLTILFGGTTVFQLTSSSQPGFFDRREVRNRGAKNAQITQKLDIAGYYGGTPRLTTIDTALAQQLTFVGDMRTVNEFIRIAGYTVSLVIGN